jgi:hypothetical protein
VESPTVATTKCLPAIEMPAPSPTEEPMWVIKSCRPVLMPRE